jgi:PadR family transcriptional regulator, regulatory protein PadR
MKTENAIQQMRKGVLELCALSVISAHEEVYPADIKKALEDAGMDIVEGTLYPLLTRLKNAAYLDYTWRESQTAGPPRKYYKITPQGSFFLSELRTSWNDFTTSVGALVNTSASETGKE